VSADDAIRRLDETLRAVPFGDLKSYIPATLYHYTSAEGLLGIIESNMLRAGNFSYVNDASELTYGRELARDVLVEEIGSVPNSTLRALSLRLQERILNINDESDFYLCCFCSAPDLLSQWRGYGSRSGRFCIGFQYEGLVSPKKPLIGNVVYKEAVQRKRLVKAIAAATSVLLQYEDPIVVGTVETMLFEKISRELCFFKNPAFVEERETRALYRVCETTDVCFSVQAGVIKPYTNLFDGTEMNGWSHPRLPIVEVIVGASTMTPAAVKSVKLLVDRYGYSNVKVSESAVPLRD